MQDTLRHVKCQKVLNTFRLLQAKCRNLQQVVMLNSLIIGYQHQRLWYLNLQSLEAAPVLSNISLLANAASQAMIAIIL